MSEARAGSHNKLADFAKDITSQNGEDGILQRVFKILGVDQGWCVEFGAWDGKKFSNTYDLINSKNWSGVLIEADSHRYEDLLSTYNQNENVICLNRFVSFSGESSLDGILSDTPLPTNFELLSIDIDGNDIHIWDSLEKFSPKVVIIEYNNTIQNCIDFRQPKDMHVNQGSSLLALIHLGKEKGYELIATTRTNGIFVQKDLYSLFAIENNHIDLMRYPSDVESYLFQLYDGTIVLRGNNKLLWNSTPIREDKLQVYPKTLRFFETTNRFKKLLQKLWRLFYTRL